MPAQIQQTATAMEDPSVQSLKVVDQSQLKKDLGLVDPKELKATEDDPKLVELAGQYVERLLAINPEDFASQTASREAVEGMGLAIEVESARRSELLREPVRALISKNDEAGDIGTDLARLKIEVEKGDPNQWSFEGGWLSRLVGHTPVLGDKIKEYFVKFEETRTVIDDIARSLRRGGHQLKRDCDILREDRDAMRKLTLRLQKLIKLALLMDKLFEEKLATLAVDDPQRNLIEQELLFPLRGRINAMQTRLLYNQTGVVSYEIVTRTNYELIRAIDLHLNSTVPGLSISATLAIALAHQKMRIEQVQAVSKVAEKLLIETTERLRKQGVDIQKMVSSPLIAIEVMKTAVGNFLGALDDLARYRKEALPGMKQGMEELDRLSATTEKAIQDMEHGNRARSSVINIDLED